MWMALLSAECTLSTAFLSIIHIHKLTCWLKYNDSPANGRYSSSTAFKNLFHLVSTSLTYSKTFSALPNKPSVVYQPPNDYHKTHCRFMGQKGQHKIRNYASVKGIKTVNVTKIKRPPARLKRQEQDMFLPEWSLLYNCSHPTQ